MATANQLQDMSGPLLDRLEVIQLSGYTLEEKRHIAQVLAACRPVPALYSTATFPCLCPPHLHQSGSCTTSSKIRSLLLLLLLSLLLLLLLLCRYTFARQDQGHSYIHTHALTCLQTSYSCVLWGTCTIRLWVARILIEGCCLLFVQSSLPLVRSALAKIIQ